MGVPPSPPPPPLAIELTLVMHVSFVCKDSEETLGERSPPLLLLYSDGMEGTRSGSGGAAHGRAPLPRRAELVGGAAARPTRRALATVEAGDVARR